MGRRLRPLRGVPRGESGMISGMAEITFQNVWKRYPDGFEAVKDMSLEIGDGSS